MSRVLDESGLQRYRPGTGQRLSMCLQRGVIRAIDGEGREVGLAALSCSPDALLWLQRTGHGLSIREVLPDDLASWIATCAASAPALGEATAGAQEVKGDVRHAAAEPLSLAHIDLVRSPVVRLVNATLFDAMRASASDVHLESTPDGLAIKYRIDGVLRHAASVSGALRAEQIVSRIKVMAELDISERRVPQDGRLQVALEGRPVDVRVSIMPSIHGEDAVLRILDRQHLARELRDLTLESLGFETPMIARVEALARRPHGMLLVTGPTGSGKTTTLYAVIQRTTNVAEKVITIEDPVEYQLPGVLQIPVNEKKGLTFARGLRSTLRHDPDKILVGEIRDAETAQIAVQAALTGHLVFTTVHANDVFDVLGRFRQFGIDGYSLASAISGILSQRLVRRLCHACVSVPDGRGWRAVGCQACGGTGYHGRFALGELVSIGSRMKGLIASGSDYEALEEEVKAQGAQGLRQCAMAAVEAGLTTREEAERVTAEP